MASEKEVETALENEPRPEDDANGNADPESALAGGRLRFYVENKPTLGLLLIKGKRSKDREWIERSDCNAFLKKAQRNPALAKELLVGRVAEMYGLSMVLEEERERLEGDVKIREVEIDHLTHKNVYYNDKLSLEEEAKRRTLLRYVHAVKAAASGGGGSGGGNNEDAREREEVGQPGAGRLQLPEAGLTDEEVHAIAAMLRGNTTIVELNLRGNLITDEGARAIAAVLNGRTALRTVDLRGNKIGRPGLRAVAEALERSERVRHVYVHAGGKIEALGTGGFGAPKSFKDDLDSNTDEGGGGGDSGPMVAVETVCVVDIRENSPQDDIMGNVLQQGDTNTNSNSTRKVENAQGNTASPFAPHNLPGVQKEGADGNSNGGQSGGNNNNNNSNSNNNNNGGGATTQKGKKAKKKSEERLARQERERKKQATMLQKQIDRENRAKEASWAGRAGGMEVSRSLEEMPRRKQNGKTVDALPPLGGGGGQQEDLVRSNSAPGNDGMGGRGGGNRTTGNRGLQDSPLMKSVRK